ncbi:hypothetical protein [Rhizobium phage RHEph16]|uniref:Uncharacterized protein n=1 Tax=Rhizobium phage RHEph16 TaxID=2836132 RepID=A0AAE7VMF4_9CAUD|nr:hypothetical protein PP750_gp93 [Rhizobium phage RHEph16]QXV74398.1 hypothetical protein [Rhizobium phage RHEph16]
MKINWYYGTALIGEPMRKNKPHYPNSREVQHSRNVLRENIKYGVGGGTRLTEDDLHVLDRYIEFLEDQLGSVIEEYQGIPTEYFNMVKREQLEWRPLGPTRLYEDLPYTLSK